MVNKIHHTYDLKLLLEGHDQHGYIQQNIIKVTLNWSEQINETNLSVVFLILVMPKLICL